MNTNVHDRIESLAGAIALGEASDQERREYREHISGCRRCLNALGGEREIERVASAVSAARDSEVWEPDLRNVVLTGARRRAKSLRWGFGVFAGALALSFGIHFLVAAGVPHVTVVAQAQPPSEAVTHVTLDRPAAAKPVVVAAPPQRLIVTHNVVQIARAPVAAPAAAPSDADKAASKTPDIIAMTVHPDRPAHSHRHSNVPVWRRSDTAWRTVATTTTTSVTETAPQSLTHSAESLQVAPSTTRDVAPVGGETAINPQPPMIAYDEGAEGTTAFEVLVDEHGVPTKCVITKSAGYPVLDDAVCKAAMKTRYTPKMVDGRAVPGVYHDAFTFRMTDQTSSDIVPAQAPSSIERVRSQNQISPIGQNGYSRGR